MYKKIKTIIETIINPKEKKEYKNFLFLEKRWEEKIEEKIKLAAKIIDYKNKTITIQTKNPSWKNELNFMRSQIKKNFQHQKWLLKT